MVLNKADQKMALWKQRILDAYNSEFGVTKWLQEKRIRSSDLYRWRRKLVVSGDISPDIFPCSEEKKQNKIELWKERISDAYRSELSIEQWCKQHGISRGAFRYWKSRFLGASNETTIIWNETTIIWKGRILEAYGSKMNISSWCKVHCISYSNFFKWKSILIQNGNLPSEMSCWRNRNKNYWKQTVLDAYTSNVCVEEWCSQHKISARVLYTWKQRLLDSGDILPSDLERDKSAREYWKQLVLEAYSSKLHIIDWCKQHQVEYSSLIGWKVKLLRKGDISHDVKSRKSKHYSDYWKPIVIDAYNNNMLITYWCEQHNVNLTCLIRWTKKLINMGEISAEMIEERTKCKKDYTKNNPRDPMFCELPAPKTSTIGNFLESNTYIGRGTTFRVGKFSLVVEEDISEEMLNVALEALNTVMEVFSND